MLDARQMAEVEIYARIEPIAWDVGVSQPPEAVDRRPVGEDEARANFERIASMLGAKIEKHKGKRKKGKR